jgi:radical SAM superfamily enzyme YgiQ (UPF0313 family)
MRVVLVDNFIMPDGLDRSLFDVHPHLGLASLAAVAQRENHSTAIYDPKREVRFGRHPYNEDFYDRAAEDILRLLPETVGFTTLGCSFLFAVNVAAILKRREPDLPILLGGPHATMLAKRILETYGQFDVVVRHEAEQTFPAMLEKLEQRAFEQIPGITWRGGKKTTPIEETAGAPKIEDLDSLPIPLYDMYPVDDLALDLMRVEAGRGCPFDCSFCSTATFFQRSYRLKSSARLVKEMDLLHARYDVDEFKLDHDLFTVNRRKVLEFCETVEDRSYRWRVSARTDCVDEELLETMAAAGCVGLYFGIETGSKRMQRITSKRLKLEGVERILDATQNLGIEATVSFITGYPEETRQDQDESLDLLGHCFQRPQDACIPQLHVLLPEPGTELFAKNREHLAYDGYSTKFNARLLRESDSDHILRHPDLYSTYYYYPAAMPRSSYTFAVDAVDAFRLVGHDILGYALRSYQNRLSVLVESFHSWIRAKRPNAVVDSALAVEFIAECFGADHHLTSLFRFGVAINARLASGLQNGMRQPASQEFDPNENYLLNPQCCVFLDVHDCGRLMDRLPSLPEDSALLEAADVGAIGCFLSIVEEGSAVHYSIDQGLGSILGLFQQPRSIRAVTKLLQQISPGASVSESWFRELIDIGVLMPVTIARGLAPSSDQWLTH